MRYNPVRATQSFTKILSALNFRKFYTQIRMSLPKVKAGKVKVTWHTLNFYINIPLRVKNPGGPTGIYRNLGGPARKITNPDGVTGLASFDRST